MDCGGCAWPCGSAPLSPALAERLPDRARAAAAGQVRHDGERAGRLQPGRRSRGDTIGVPLPGVLARIRAAAGLAVPGEDGEIHSRAAGLRGYWNDPAGTEAASTRTAGPDRRHRVRGPGRQAPRDPRPEQGNDHHRRPERLTPRGGDRARGPSVGGGGGRDGRPRRAVGRAGDRLGGPRGRAGSTRPRSSRTPGRCWPGKVPQAGVPAGGAARNQLGKIVRSVLSSPNGALLPAARLPRYRGANSARHRIGGDRIP